MRSSDGTGRGRGKERLASWRRHRSARRRLRHPAATRYDELKQMLEERQRELVAEVQGKIRGVRADGAEKPHEVMDQGETSEVDIQEDIELALIQMKAETLNKINEALARLEDGRYGLVLRVRRRDRRGASACAAVRGPLQGLRRGPRNRGPA